MQNRRVWINPAPVALQNNTSFQIEVFPGCSLLINPSHIQAYNKSLEKDGNEIRTTNVIERSFAEVRRRLKVMAYFQNTKSCKRIVLSLFFYFNKKWDRRSVRRIQMKKNYPHRSILFCPNLDL